MRPVGILIPLTLALASALACDRTPEPKRASDSALAANARAEPQPGLVDSASPREPETQGYRLPSRARLVAIGDIHGDLSALRAALRLAGAIDSEDTWIGKDLTVVQTGDQVDRGDQDREVLDLLEKLELDATKSGSELRVLNGNHELMNAGFDFRYVTAKSFRSFDEFAERVPVAAGNVPSEGRGRAAAFAPGGSYALKLARHLTVAVVGDTLFAHGGVLPAHVDYGLSRINREAEAFLSGKLPRLPAALSGEDSPVWTRVYGSPELEPSTCEALGRVLQGVGAKRLVVGHTVQKDGISSACQERVFRIDVGLSAYYGDRPAQVLEITKSGARVLDAKSERPAPVREPGSRARDGSAPRDSALH